MLFLQKFVQSFHRPWKVFTTQPKAKVIAGIIIHRTGQKKNTCLFDQAIAKSVHIPAEVAWEGHRAGLRTHPGKQLSPENTSIQHAALGSAITSNGTAAGYFAGIIDEARVWNYAKTIEQIRSDINSQLITNQSGLLSRWGLNDGTGTIVHSNAGTSVNGTITGTGSSWITPGAPFNISFAPPTAPSGLTATAPSAYQINLSWTDNSDNETNFEIERSTTGISGTYTLLATVGANVITYGDGTVTISNEYCYRVRAINSFGNSAYSDPACATPAEGDYALDFGTGTGYVTFVNNAALGLANITLETWCKREGTGTTANTGTGGMLAIPLVTKGRGEAENSNVDMNYFLGIRSSDNVIAADFEEGASGSTPGLNHPIFGTTPIVNNVWYHASRIRTALALPAAAALFLGASAGAQGYDPRFRWRTLSTPRFQVHFHQGEEALARRVAGAAERAHQLLSPLLRHDPGLTHVLLSDDSDDANGSSTPVPYNTVRLFAVRPTPSRS